MLKTASWVEYTKSRRVERTSSMARQCRSRQSSIRELGLDPWLTVCSKGPDCWVCQKMWPLRSAVAHKSIIAFLWSNILAHDPVWKFDKRFDQNLPYCILLEYNFLNINCQIITNKYCTVMFGGARGPARLGWARIATISNVTKWEPGLDLAARQKMI